MSRTDWPVYTPFAREHFSRGKEEGLAEGRIEGRAEGRIEGWVEGWVEGEAYAVLRVLAARRIEVPADARARISGCGDVRQLDLWLDRAVDATCIADLFD